MNIQLKTVGIVAKDLGKSLEFYRVLGVEIPAVAPEESNVEVETPSGVVMGFLTEETARRADPDFVTPVGQSMNLQFECESPTSVDAVYARIIEAGFASYAAPWDAMWGQRFARVVDPDGRVVNIYAEL